MVGVGRDIGVCKTTNNRLARFRSSMPALCLEETHAAQKLRSLVNHLISL